MNRPFYKLHPGAEVPEHRRLIFVGMEDGCAVLTALLPHERASDARQICRASRTARRREQKKRLTPRGVEPNNTGQTT